MSRFSIILFISFFTISCSEFSERKKISSIQKCADPYAIEYGVIIFDKKGNKNIGFVVESDRKSIDPLGLLKEDSLKVLKSIPLEVKLKEELYEKIWSKCEEEFHTFPVKFKKKY